MLIPRYHFGFFNTIVSNTPDLTPQVSRLSRVCPLWPLAQQAARYGAHLSPSLRAPARHQTYLDSTSLITFPIYVTPFGSFPSRHCFCVSFMSVRCSCFWFCIMLHLFITLTL
jgi:hypothetical protein